MLSIKAGTFLLKKKREDVDDENVHSVRQHQQPPAQQYFSLTPLQYQFLATSQSIVFFLTPL